MSKSYRAWQIAAVAFAMAVSIWAVAAHPLHDLGLAAFFAALILCASFLRIEADEASVAFEAPIVFGAIIIFVVGRMEPLPFYRLINPETKRMQPRKVDIKGEAYESARRYMIRLERSDFEEPELSQLAHAAGLSPDRFRARFGYLVGL